VELHVNVKFAQWLRAKEGKLWVIGNNGTKTVATAFVRGDLANGNMTQYCIKTKALNTFDSHSMIFQQGGEFSEGIGQDMQLLQFTDLQRQKKRFIKNRCFDWDIRLWQIHA
jgi:hypothetical protein